MVLSAKTIGRIAQINRYPVKSFAGESLASCRIDAYGLYGDRSRAFIDETKSGWDQYFTARNSASMLGYTAKLTSGDEGGAFPKVRITAADGRKLEWDESLLAEIQALSKNKLALKQFSPVHDELLGVDEGGILVITDKSLRRLEELWGKPLDGRRFRANLLIETNEEAGDEQDWIGKQLKIGDVVLDIQSACSRCSMITIDPERLDRDSSLLKTVNEYMQLAFGVYASVRKTGAISAFDEVQLTD